jgi:hypothetical protein
MRITHPRTPPAARRDAPRGPPAAAARSRRPPPPETTRGRMPPRERGWRAGSRPCPGPGAPPARHGGGPRLPARAGPGPVPRGPGAPPGQRPAAEVIHLVLPAGERGRQRALDVAPRGGGVQRGQAAQAGQPDSGRAAAPAVRNRHPGGRFRPVRPAAGLLAEQPIFERHCLLRGRPERRLAGGPAQAEEHVCDPRRPVCKAGQRRTPRGGPRARAVPPGPPGQQVPPAGGGPLQRRAVARCPVDGKEPGHGTRRTRRTRHNVQRGVRGDPADVHQLRGDAQRGGAASPAFEKRALALIP